MSVIVLAVLLVYFPSFGAGFVWDDEQLITGNPLLRNVGGLGEIWSGGRTVDYFPVTNTVFWIEWHLFGNNPAGYHILNILLQAADAVLVWIVLRRLEIPGAWMAGLVFAVHPINVESVAWISELKNVLSMFFALVSLICFLGREAGRRTANNLAAICFFVLALLSKSQAVFLPVVFLLCEWWRSGNTTCPSLRRRAIRTWPFFLAAVIFGLITIWFQNRGIGGEEIATGSLGRRLVNAAMAIWWYAGKVLVPIRLMAIYPPWRFDAVRSREWLPLIGFVAAIVLLWHGRNRGSKGTFFAFACFVLALSPVVGFIRMAYLRSGTLVAEHFVYFAGVSLIALIAAAIACIWSRAQGAVRVSVAAVVTVMLAASGIYSSTRVAVFHDEETLWQDTLAKNPKAWQAQVRLGQLLFNRQDYAAALPHLQSAVLLKPELADNRNLLGLDYSRLDRFEEGIAEYRKALALEEARSPAENAATIRTNLANALTLSANTIDRGAAKISEEALRRFEEAIAQYEQALATEPRQAAIHRNLGMVLARLGRYDEAIAHLRTALEIVPNEPTSRATLDEIEAQRH